MRTIHKYLIGDCGTASITTGVHAIFRHFGDQDGRLFAWFELDDDEPKRDRKVGIFGTGHSIPEDADYLGTTLSGPFVWHLYEVYL